LIVTAVLIAARFAHFLALSVLLGIPFALAMWAGAH